MQIIATARLADPYGAMHDPAAAARFVEASDPERTETGFAAATLPFYAAMDSGSGRDATIPALEDFWKTFQMIPRVYIQESVCDLGLSYGMTGRMAEAVAMFKRPHPLSPCDAFHGDVLEHANDLAGA